MLRKRLWEKCCPQGILTVYSIAFKTWISYCIIYFFRDLKRTMPCAKTASSGPLRQKCTTPSLSPKCLSLANLWRLQPLAGRTPLCSPMSLSTSMKNTIMVSNLSFYPLMRGLQVIYSSIYSILLTTDCFEFFQATEMTVWSLWREMKKNMGCLSQFYHTKISMDGQWMKSFVRSAARTIAHSVAFSDVKHLIGGLSFSSVMQLLLGTMQMMWPKRSSWICYVVMLPVFNAVHFTSL